MSRISSYFALVPAAGGGSRAGGAVPKQYLPVFGRPLIAHTLQSLSAVKPIEAVFVVLAPIDDQWIRHDWSMLNGKIVPLYCGGATRAESVANGLRAIADHVKPEDWVLVHDAARPCLTATHVMNLMREVGDDPIGGILALPVADTLKRSDADHRIEVTVARDALWQAQTPQMFRHAMLLKALTGNVNVTDEASAIESLGYRPKLVASDASNLKVTYPQDLQLAELILKERTSV
jgi:2-C-methyl-D-erythritol 4-phosphate cytidylyltransferase